MIEPRSILAFRNGSIGNTLVAMPALEALRVRWPAAKLSVVVDPIGFELLEACPWIDRLIIYDKRGRHASLWSWLQLVRELRALGPSHAVLFKRFYRNGLLAYLSGAKIRCGFSTNGRRPFLNRTIPYVEGQSVVALNLKLAELLDAREASPVPTLYLREQDREKAREWLVAQKLTAPFVAVHYGGLTTDANFFPAARMRDLVAKIARSYSCILIGSGAREAQAAIEICRGTERTVSAVGLPLRVTCGLIERCAAFLGMNSGPAHIAAAAQRPGVVLYKPTPQVEQELSKWRPMFSGLKQQVVPANSAESDMVNFMSAVLQDLGVALAAGEQI